MHNDRPQERCTEWLQEASPLHCRGKVLLFVKYVYIPGHEVPKFWDRWRAWALAEARSLKLDFLSISKTEDITPVLNVLSGSGPDQALH